MIVVGLTGSIGMGKTAASRILQDMGIPVHESDAAVHALLGPGGGAVAAVAAAFPGVLLRDDKNQDYIDRQALGRIVFADAAQKKALEDILHPLVRAASDVFRRDMKSQGYKIIVLDIPLLFETGGDARVDVTLCVTAPPETQRARVLARPGMTEEKFARIVAGQMPDAEKRRRAHHVVDTGEGMDDTRLQLQKIVEQLQARSDTNNITKK